MPDKPNIVIFISDQQRTDTMACYGNEWIQTPNLNALADQSYVFENAYVTQPVCTPARASLMTGLYPHSAGAVVNRVPIKAEVKTIAEMFPDDYTCAHFGKWHLGDDPVPQHGFTHWISTEDDYRSSYTKPGLPYSTYYHHLLSNGFEPEDTSSDGTPIFSFNQRAKLPPEFAMASFLADEAARFIKANANKPFLLVVSTFEPHPPMTGPFDGMYDPDEIPVGPSFLVKPEGASQFNIVRAEHYLQATVEGKDLTREENWRLLRANYFGNVTLIDNAVGKIMAALNDAGIADKTAFAFTTDHGEMAGDHGLLEKRAFYEESSRVPMLLRVPWLNDSQEKIGGAFGHVDLVPTLLDLAGQDVPEPLEGESRLSTLQGTGNLDNNHAFIQWEGVGDRNLGNARINELAEMSWRCVVSGDRWKLNLCATDQCELFDLNSDPFEMNNLFDDASHRERIHDLASRIYDWQRHTGDNAPLPRL